MSSCARCLPFCVLVEEARQARGDGLQALLRRLRISLEVDLLERQPRWDAAHRLEQFVLARLRACVHMIVSAPWGGGRGLGGGSCGQRKGYAERRLSSRLGADPWWGVGRVAGSGLLARLPCWNIWKPEG